MSLSAQLNDNFKFYFQTGQELKMHVKGGDNSNKRAFAAEWFDYVNAYNDFNGAGLETSGFVSWIQPDTNLDIVSSTGTKTNIAFHVIGRINDPRDEVFDNNPRRFSRHTSYTWDSIRWLQFYIRNEDSMKVGANMVPIVDTVFIQYFLPSGLDNQGYIYQSDPSKNYFYSCPKRNNYNKTTKLNSAAFKTDTIFLTAEWADSLSIADSRVFGRNIAANVGGTVTQNPTNVNGNLVGHTITFKPMRPTKLGDTGLAFNGAPIFNKHNMFGLSLFAKTGVKFDIDNPEAQNNAVITNYEVGYGQTINIFKSYIPGTLFGNTIFESTDYFLTSNNVSVNTVDAFGNGLGNIYPNPSAGANEVMVPVKLSSSQTVTLTICDITGKVIKTISAEYNAGDFDIAVSTLGLNNGLYTCTMVAGDFKATTKFVLN